MSLEERPDFRQNLLRVGGYTRNTLTGFRAFILRGNVVDLAVGIVIGAAFTSVVNALVNNVITPLIPVPGNSLGGLSWPVPWAEKPGVVVNLSAFINAVISFLIVALVLYFFIVRPVNSLMDRYKPKIEEPVTQRDCPFCLQSIPLKAVRCAYCTSMLVDADNQPIVPQVKS